MQWYLDALYLNHGHAFFAPIRRRRPPGPLPDVSIENAQYETQGEFPNRKGQWPRLFYHRYFMLADQMGRGSATGTIRKSKSIRNYS